MIYPLLPAFVVGTLGGSPVALGALDGAADLTSAMLKVASGRLADRPGWRRPLILAGYAAAVLIRPLISAAAAAWQVVGLRVLDRVGKGVRTPPRDALIAEVTPAPQRGRAFGFHRGADHFGAVLGSLAAWWLLTRGAEVRSVIAWSIVPGIVAFVVLAAVLRGAARRPPPVTPGPSRGDADGRVFWVPVAALAALALFRLPETLFILRLQDQGVAVATVPLVWAGLHVVRSGSSYPGGWLSDHLGPANAIAAGGALFAMAAGTLAMDLSPAAALGVFLALGGAAGLTESAERVVVAQLAPVRTGLGFGVYHALIGVMALPAGLLFGAVYDTWGGGPALAASATGMLLATGFWLVAAPGKMEGAET